MTSRISQIAERMKGITKDGLPPLRKEIFGICDWCGEPIIGVDGNGGAGMWIHERERNNGTRAGRSCLDGDGGRRRSTYAAGLPVSDIQQRERQLAAALEDVAFLLEERERMVSIILGIRNGHGTQRDHTV